MKRSILLLVLILTAVLIVSGCGVKKEEVKKQVDAAKAEFAKNYVSKDSLPNDVNPLIKKQIDEYAKKAKNNLDDLKRSLEGKISSDSAAVFALIDTMNAGLENFRNSFTQWAEKLENDLKTNLDQRFSLLDKENKETKEDINGLRADIFRLDKDITRLGKYSSSAGHKFFPFNIFQPGFKRTPADNIKIHVEKK